MRVLRAIAVAVILRPGVSLAALAGLVVLSLAGFVGPAPSDAFAAGAEWRAADAARSDFFLDDEVGFLAIFGPVLDPRHGAALRAMEQRVEGLPWVGELVTPFDWAADTTLEEAVRRPLLRGTLIDAEGRGLMLPLSFREGAPGLISSDWVDELTRTARAPFASAPHGVAPLEVGVTGKWPLVRAQDEALTRERWRFQLMGAIFGFLIAALSFRDLRATFLAGLPPLLGVFVAIGVGRGLGLGGSGFTSIVLPLLVLTIGFTDSLHIVVAAARARRTGSIDGAAAAQLATLELIGPCALTSLTTAIGFASLAATGNSLVSEFGLSCALATGVTFLCVVLSIPLLCRTPLGATLDRVRPPTVDEPPSRPIARLVDLGLRVSLRSPRVVAALALGLTLTAAWVASGLHADRRVASDLAELDGVHSAARTLARVDAELGGALPIHVRMDWDEGTDGEVLLRTARAARAALAGTPFVAGAVGPAELLDGLATVVGAASAADPAATWPLLSLVPERWRRPFVDLDGRSALLHARIPDAGSRALAGWFESLAIELAALEVPGVRLALVGEHFAYLRTVERVTGDLARSLALAAVLILVTLGVAFRSWRLGLASVVPNLLPLAASAAWLSVLGGSVDVSTLTALTLSLGIATDDTIHVIARWKRGHASGLSPGPAARYAVLRTYPALAVTTMTLTVAFGQLLTSSIPTIRDFGLVAAMSLAVAFFADIWLLPAIVVALHGRRARPELSHRQHE